jgi:molybdopterin-binding protein
MPQFRISEAARLLGVSDDTMRRHVNSGRITGATDDAGRLVVDGVELASFTRSLAAEPRDPGTGHASARNRFLGLVSAITVDGVMAQVELQCGPHRVVSLISAEAVRDLGLEVGSVATAVVKATSVMVNTPSGGA